MDWASERYVRLYIRDTADWLMLPWQARALWPHILRKCDRAGTIALGKHGLRVLPTIVTLPPEVVDPGIAALIEDGCVRHEDERLAVPNFQEAQTTRSNAKIRKEDQRFREKSEQVTNTEGDPSTRHLQSPHVTSRHPESPPVTLAGRGGAVLSGTERGGAVLPGDARSLVAVWNELVPEYMRTDVVPARAGGAIEAQPLAAWRGVFESVAGSEFYTGRDQRRRRGAVDLAYVLEHPDEILERGRREAPVQVAELSPAQRRRL